MKIELPGFFDLQVNGFASVDFNTPGCTTEQLNHAIASIMATGVTQFLPTLITSSFDRFATCARAVLEVAHPAIVGIHMEGPYISPNEGARGAHPREHVIGADLDDFKRRQQSAGGCIVLVTLAPEVPGALQLIEYLVDCNIRVAIGHTSASPEQIRDAIIAGATLSTHLGNGCMQLLPRHPNLIWEQLAADELFASLIVDGHHLPPPTVKSMIRAKTPSRTILVTDATAATGCPPGRFMIGEVQIEASAYGQVVIPGSPYLAGSALAMHLAIANAVKFTGLPLSEIIPMASTLPAYYMGREVSGRVSAEWDAVNYRLSVDTVAINNL
jgi:N-acetylglucosamine-6-phosphate deacetylase